MADGRYCPRCGKPLPRDVPAGACPACLLRTGLETGARAAPLDDSNDDEADFAFEPTSSGRVLDTLARSIGSVPRVLLADTAPDDRDVALIKPSSAEMPAPGQRGERYQLFGEIARGGMGAVLKGRDADLGRDLAVKVLLEAHREKPELLRRFVEEAQIGGQLQHPGIVPVYELGTFADSRPYFTMKLVKGRTLAALLHERGNPQDDLPRFLGVFEQVCQTVAYAHARGVIHRDLKPANVMVGAFGEVQVMDWGLAKVLKEGGVADEPPAAPEPRPVVSVIQTVRSGSDFDDSQAGSLLGTPAYMAPEQAGGETERIDRRADVFGLGSILCEVLTGHPAYTGRSVQEVVRKATRGDNADAMARLDACGAEPELIALARDCLASEPEDRPRAAGPVADRVTAYLAGVQARVRAAERERAVAVARAIEERRRRKVQLALAASVLAFTTLGGLSTTYYLQHRAARAAATDRVVGQVVTLRDQAKANPGDQSRWQVALAAVEQAEAAGDAGAGDRLLALRTEIQGGLDAAERDQKLLDRLVDIRSARADDPDGSATDAAYDEAFRDAGLDPEALTPAELAARLTARPDRAIAATAAALDDWARMERDRRKDRAGATRLAAAARAVDPDEWRNRLRDALELADTPARRAALLGLADSLKGDGLPAVGFDLLGLALTDAGERERAEAVLRIGQRAHPRDVWLNYDLARALEDLGRRVEAIRYYAAARAIRPETAHELAHALEDSGEEDEAIAVFRDLARLRPDNGRHLGCLGESLRARGLTDEAEKILGRAEAALRARARQRPDDSYAHASLGLVLQLRGKTEEAIAACREAIRLDPGLATAHTNLGLQLKVQGKLEAAIAELREAIRLRPGDAVVHSSLGAVLATLEKWDEAIAECREAIRLDPGNAQAHSNLGLALSRREKRDEAIAELRAAIRLKPGLVEAHSNLGDALLVQGKVDEAIAEHREAIRLRPGDARVRAGLGSALRRQGRPGEAIAELREAIRLEPSLAEARVNLAFALMDVGKLDEAIAECREAIRLKPGLAEAHNGLGTVLLGRGSLDEAVAELREAIRLKPDDADAHSNLGSVLLAQGKVEEAIAEHRAALRLNRDPNHPNIPNNLAWALSISPGREPGDYDEAAALAPRSIALEPKDGSRYNTLALAEYRRGHWDDAIASAEQSIKLIKGVDASNWFFLAMAHARKGEKDQAITWFDKAVRWTMENAPKHPELLRFWSEAARSLGRPGLAQEKR